MCDIHTHLLSWRHLYIQQKQSVRVVSTISSLCDDLVLISCCSTDCCLLVIIFCNTTSSDASRRRRGIDYRHYRRSLSPAVYAVADREDTVTSLSLPDNEGRELWHVWHPVRKSYYAGKARKASSKGSKLTVSLGTTTVYS